MGSSIITVHLQDFQGLLLTIVFEIGLKRSEKSLQMLSLLNVLLNIIERRSLEFTMATEVTYNLGCNL